MAKIVIKKKVSLDFLGEDYKEAYFIFQTIPLPDYKEFMKSIPETSVEFSSLVKKIDSGEYGDEDISRLQELRAERDNKEEKELDIIMNMLKKYFMSGKFPNEKNELEEVSKDDLDGIDQDCAMHCFKALTGRLDPKVPAQ